MPLQLIIALTLIFLTAACSTPTPYKSADAKDKYGYRDQKVQSTRYRVTFQGNWFWLNDDEQKI